MDTVAMAEAQAGPAAGGGWAAAPAGPAPAAPAAGFAEGDHGAGSGVVPRPMPAPAGAERAPPAGDAAPGFAAAAGGAEAPGADARADADMAGGADGADADDAPSSYEHQPPFRPRRNPARLWTAAAIVFAVLALAAAAAVVRFGGGDWLPVAAASAFSQAQPDLALDFPPNRQDRRTLPDGTQFFGISGRITNIGHERRSLPNLLILLRDGHDRVVYSWEVVPARRVLGPGESENVIEAVTDIPRAAKVADIGWKAG